MINTESDYAWLRVVALELVAEGNLWSMLEGMLTVRTLGRVVRRSN